MIPNVLSVAAVDPSGGAGLFADIRTVAALGGYGCGCVAALTVQNTRGVKAVRPVEPDFLAAELEAVFCDMRIDAVKVGALGTAALVRVVAAAIDRYRPKAVVVDPVLVSTSGARLLDEAGRAALLEELLPLATLVTPNIPEAAVVAGGPPPEDAPGMERLARAFLEKAGCRAALLKGGHLAGGGSPDFLLGPGIARWYPGRRIAAAGSHGTGCTLSSAVATRLALGDALELAVQRARGYVRSALAASGNLSAGQGNGPVDHLFVLRKVKENGFERRGEEKMV